MLIRTDMNKLNTHIYREESHIIHILHVHREVIFIQNKTHDFLYYLILKRKLL